MCKFPSCYCGETCADKQVQLGKPINPRERQLEYLLREIVHCHDKQKPSQMADAIGHAKELLSHD